MSNYFNQQVDKLLNNPKKWLVTGCAGFIGSNLTEFLLSKKQMVIGLDNFSTGKKENIEDIKNQVGEELAKNFTFVEGDIRDIECCKKVMEGVDYVLHQAALGSVPRSIEDPKNSHDSNVNGFLNMLIASKEVGVKRVVYASSSSVYGDHPQLPKVEAQIGTQLSPYAVTKYINELYADVFYKCYGLETVGLRYFNVFGKRQDPDSIYAAVMPKWIKAMMSNEEVFINGDGKTSRDFCFIDNVVQMNFLAAISENKSSINQIYNVACHDQTDLNTLFELLRSGLEKHFLHLAQFKPTYRDFRAGDVRHSFANIEKANELIGYKPTHMLKDGIEKSLNWYRTNL